MEDTDAVKQEDKNILKWQCRFCKLNGEWESPCILSIKMREGATEDRYNCPRHCTFDGSEDAEWERI